MWRRCLVGLVIWGLVAVGVNAEPLVMPLIGWLNLEAKSAQLVVLGRVRDDCWPDPKTAVTRVNVEVTEAFLGTAAAPKLAIHFVGAHQQGRFQMPPAFVKDQWLLAFVKQRANRWVAGPVGHIVGSDDVGIGFYPPPAIVLNDVSLQVSWPYVLDSLRQMVATRRQIEAAYRGRLKAARTKEERDRVRFAIEVEVKECLGLPVP